MRDGKITTLPKGDRELDRVKWVYHDRIGYILPDPAKVQISNQTEQGRWSDITDETNVSDQLVSEDVFMLGFNHGNQPDNGAYEYIVVPNVSEGELKTSCRDNRGIEILRNDSHVQAVKSNKLGVCQLVFYSAGEVEISKGRKVGMNSPGIALLKFKGERIAELTAADPSRKRPKIKMTVPGIYRVTVENFAAFPDRVENTTLIVIDLPQGVYSGMSVRVKLHAEKGK